MFSINDSFTGSFSAGRRPRSFIPDPTVLPNGFFWYNADLGSAANFGSVITSGTAITTWKDVYAGAHDANQSGNTSVKPTWQSGVLNSYGIARFNGTSQSLNINPVNKPAPGLQGISGYTLFVVAKASSLTGTRPLTSTDTGGFKIYFNGTNWAAATSSGIGVSSLIGDTTNFHLFTLIYDGNQGTSATRLRFRYDTIDQTLNFGATTVGSTTSASASYFYLGTDATNYFAGDIAEMILYARTLSANDMSSVEAYFKVHWGL